MTEPTTLTPAPAAANGPPAADADARLARIEAALATLAAQQAAGPPPEGYSRPNTAAAGQNALATLGSAVQVAQVTGYLPGGEQARQRLRKGWRKWPVVREVLMVFKLYLDKRYSPTRAAQLGVPAILILLVLSALYFNLLFVMPVVSQVVEYLIAMALAVFLYRILASELARYSEVLDYLARTGRG